MSPGLIDPIGLLYRLCSQTDLWPLLRNLIQLRVLLQFQSQHGCSAHLRLGDGRNVTDKITERQTKKHHARHPNTTHAA